MELHNVFSNFIVVDSVDDVKVDSVLSACMEVKELMGSEERNLYQSLSDERFAPLFNSINKKLEFVGKEYLKLKHHLVPKISSCRINYKANPATFFSHAHPGQFLLACYYLTEGSNLRFTTPNPTVEWAMPTRRNNNIVTETTPYTMTWYDVTPKPGKVVIWPSWLQHYVNIDEENLSKERISISMNSKLFYGTKLYDCSGGNI